jgi:hypothetical protein
VTKCGVAWTGSFAGSSFLLLWRGAGEEAYILRIRDEWEPRTASERCGFRTLAPFLDSTRFIGDYVRLGCDLCSDFLSLFQLESMLARTSLPVKASCSVHRVCGWRVECTVT